MSDGTRAQQVRIMGTGETRNVAVSFLGKLDNDNSELLTGTPTAVEQDTSDLTITSVTRSAAALTIVDDTTVANQAVLFSVAGGTTGVSYDILVKCGTDSSPAQNLEITVEVVFI